MRLTYTTNVGQQERRLGEDELARRFTPRGFEPLSLRQVLRQNEAMGVTVRVRPCHLDGFTRSAIRVGDQVAP